MKKILLPGLAAGIAMFLVMMASGIVFSAIFPSTAAEYSVSQAFRPWSDPLMNYMYLHPILMGFLLALVWQNTQGLMKQKDKLKKGAEFGFYIWLIFGIPGMLMTLSTFNVSVLMVLTWTLSVLAQYLTGGIVFACLDKK